MSNVFTTVINNGQPPLEAPATLNGTGGTVDMSSIGGFVKPGYMIVVNEDGSYNLRASLALSIHHASGDPAQLTAITAEHLAAGAHSIAAQVYRYGLLDAVAHSSHAGAIKYRLSDTMSIGQWEAVGNHANCYAMADQVWAHMLTSARGKSAIAPSPTLSILSLCAQYLHRALTEGHSWYSEFKKGSPTHKALQVGGASVEQLAEFQAIMGHDLWHILTDQSLNAIAYGLAGEIDIILEANYLIEGIPVGAGATLKNVMKTPASATDRIPFNVAGLSSIILGLPLLVSMAEFISFRTDADQLPEVRNLLATCLEAIEGANVDRACILAMRSAVGPVIAIAVGMSSATAATNEYVEAHASLGSFAARFPLEVLRGSGVGNALKSVDIDKSKVIEAAAGVLDSMIHALNALSTVLQGAGDDDEA